MLSNLAQGLPKWVLAGLLLVLAGLLLLVAFVVDHGIYLSKRCETSRFFGMDFGRDGCDANGAGVVVSENATFWYRSIEFQPEIIEEIDNADRSVFMSGTSFYRSVGNHVKDAALSGKKFRYVFLNPDISNETMEEFARFFGQRSSMLRAELNQTFEALRGIFCDLKEQEVSGNLKVRLTDTLVGSRLYFFDSSNGTEEIHAYVVPYVSKSNSPDLPGFRVDGEIARSYQQKAEIIWENAVPWNPESDDHSSCS